MTISLVAGHTSGSNDTAPAVFLAIELPPELQEFSPVATPREPAELNLTSSFTLTVRARVNMSSSVGTRIVVVGRVYIASEVVETLSHEVTLSIPQLTLVHMEASSTDTPGFLTTGEVATYKLNVWVPTAVTSNLTLLLETSAKEFELVSVTMSSGLMMELSSDVQTATILLFDGIHSGVTANGSIETIIVTCRAGLDAISGVTLAGLSAEATWDSEPIGAVVVSSTYNLVTDPVLNVSLTPMTRDSETYDGSALLTWKALVKNALGSVTMAHDVVLTALFELPEGGLGWLIQVKGNISSPELNGTKVIWRLTSLQANREMEALISLRAPQKLSPNTKGLTLTVSASYNSHESNYGRTLTAGPVTTIATSAKPISSFLVTASDVFSSVGTDVAVLERVTLQYNTILPVGETAAIILITVPKGLLYIHKDDLTVMTGSSLNCTAGMVDVSVVNAEKSSATIDLGRCLVSAGFDDDRTVAVSIDVTVLNDPRNIDGSSVNICGTVEYDDGLPSIKGTTIVQRSLTIVEPQLGLTITALPSYNVDAGDSCVYTMILETISGARTAAYGISGSILLPDSVQVLDVTGSMTNGKVVPTSWSDADKAFTWNQTQLVASDSVILQITTQVAGNVWAGSTVNLTMSAEVLYDGYPSNQMLNGINGRSYFKEVTSGPVQAAPKIVSISTLTSDDLSSGSTIGETIRLRSELLLPEITSEISFGIEFDNVPIEPESSPQLTIVGPALLKVGDGLLCDSFAVVQASGPSGFLGTTANLGRCTIENVSTGNARVSLDQTYLVLDNTARNVQGNVLTANAIASYSTLYEGGPLTEIKRQQAVIVTEPSVNVIFTYARPAARAGDRVSWRATIGGSFGYDITAIVRLPASLTSSVQVLPSSLLEEISPGQLVLKLGDISSDSKTTIVIEAVLPIEASPGDRFEASVDLLTWCSAVNTKKHLGRNYEMSTPVSLGTIEVVSVSVKLDVNDVAISTDAGDLVVASISILHGAGAPQLFDLSASLTVPDGLTTVSNVGLFEIKQLNISGTTTGSQLLRVDDLIEADDVLKVLLTVIFTGNSGTVELSVLSNQLTMKKLSVPLVFVKATEMYSRFSSAIAGVNDIDAIAVCHELVYFDVFLHFPEGLSRNVSIEIEFQSNAELLLTDSGLASVTGLTMTESFPTVVNLVPADDNMNIVAMAYLGDVINLWNQSENTIKVSLAIKIADPPFMKMPAQSFLEFYARGKVQGEATEKSAKSKLIIAAPVLELSFETEIGNIESTTEGNETRVVVFTFDVQPSINSIVDATSVVLDFIEEEMVVLNMTRAELGDFAAGSVAKTVVLAAVLPASTTVTCVSVRTSLQGPLRVAGPIYRTEDFLACVQIIEPFTGLPIGAIAGLTLGLLLIILVIFIVLRRRHQSGKKVLHPTGVGKVIRPPVELTENKVSGIVYDELIPDGVGGYAPVDDANGLYDNRSRRKHVIEAPSSATYGFNNAEVGASDIYNNEEEKKSHVYGTGNEILPEDVYVNDGGGIKQSEAAPDCEVYGLGVKSKCSSQSGSISQQNDDPVYGITVMSPAVRGADQETYGETLYGISRQMYGDDGDNKTYANEAEVCANNGSDNDMYSNDTKLRHRPDCEKKEEFVRPKSTVYGLSGDAGGGETQLDKLAFADVGRELMMATSRISTRLQEGPLIEVMETGDKSMLASINACITYLLRPSVLREIGLFRVSGNKTHILQYAERFEKGEHVDLITECFEPETICGLLKHLMKKSNMPLTTEFAKQIVAAATGPQEGRLAVTRALIRVLPDERSLTLKAVLGLLRKIEETEGNLMNAANLGICIGPTLLPETSMNCHASILHWLVNNISDLWPAAEYSTVTKKNSMVRTSCKLEYPDVRAEVGKVVYNAGTVKSAVYEEIGRPMIDCSGMAKHSDLNRPPYPDMLYPVAADSADPTLEYADPQDALITDVAGNCEENYPGVPDKQVEPDRKSKIPGYTFVVAKSARLLVDGTQAAFTGKQGEAPALPTRLRPQCEVPHQIETNLFRGSNEWDSFETSNSGASGHQRRSVVSFIGGEYLETADSRASTFSSRTQVSDLQWPTERSGRRRSSQL